MVVTLHTSTLEELLHLHSGMIQREFEMSVLGRILALKSLGCYEDLDPTRREVFQSVHQPSRPRKLRKKERINN